MQVTKKLDEWPIKIIDGDRSSRYPKRKEMVSKGVLFLSTPALVDGSIDTLSSNFITQEKFNSISKGRLENFDIVMTTRGTIGKLAFFKSSLEFPTGLINAQMLILRADPEFVRPKYLFYLMGSDKYQSQMKSFSSGSAQPQIPITDLKKTALSFPSIEIQDQVIALIDGYTNLVKNNNRRIAILEEMAQSLYREWFVNFRYPGHADDTNNTENSNKPTLIDSPLGPIPEGWEVKKFSELVNYKTGKLNSNAAVVGGDYPFFTCSRETYRTNTWSFDCECVLLAGNNANAIYPIKYFNGKFDAYQRTYVITEKDRYEITPSFLFYCLELKLGQLKSMSTGTSTRFLTKGILDNLDLLIPSSALISEFDSIAVNLLNSQAILRKKNENLKKQRDMLLPKLISGDIEVQENYHVKN